MLDSSTIPHVKRMLLIVSIAGQKQAVHQKLHSCLIKEKGRKKYANVTEGCKPSEQERACHLKYEGHNSPEIFSPKMDKMTLLARFHSSLLPATCNSSLSSPSADFRKPDCVASKEVWHTMNDKELLLQAAAMPHDENYQHKSAAKVAFLFLSKGRLPLRPLWERFFKGHDGLFSIYVHYSPEFKDQLPKSSVFFKRRIPSKQVEWGRPSMIDAERRLLANALLDSSNVRFVLLSETCIPLFNFTTIYNYLINSHHTFVSSFDDPRSMGRGRYSKRMQPAVSKSDWLKGSQWFEVNRRIAIKIVSDQKYYPIFGNYCKPPCYMDEHYLPTLVTKLFPGLNSNRTITWADWSKAGTHPTSFLRRDISDRCTYNGRPGSPCFLFARKFHRSSLGPLLQLTSMLITQPM
ncbi:hypothetical protein ACLOJK_033038 [Asimina triloba]